MGWRVRCRECKTLIEWDGSIADRPKCPKCHPAEAVTRTQQQSQKRPGRIRIRARSDECECAIEQCDRIISACRDVPSAGMDFADSVSEKVESMQATIEETGRVTQSQLTALDNMEYGVMRWLENDCD